MSKTETSFRFDFDLRKSLPTVFQNKTMCYVFNLWHDPCSRSWNSIHGAKVNTEPCFVRGDNQRRRRSFEQDLGANQ